ncbi:UNVERIFIED_CONTAM: hypothetical protein Sangu_1730500 [Sesamum angustifolium]|uniref:Uncharacterized protein n=1 Tax=Sesamum angustifolium TaxID=2727405 RepID=A0AAW2M4U7_9LAMI
MEDQVSASPDKSTSNKPGSPGRIPTPKPTSPSRPSPPSCPVSRWPSPPRKPPLPPSSKTAKSPLKYPNSSAGLIPAPSTTTSVRGSTTPFAPPSLTSNSSFSAFFRPSLASTYPVPDSTSPSPDSSPSSSRSTPTKLPPAMARPSPSASLTSPTPASTTKPNKQPKTAPRSSISAWSPPAWSLTAQFGRPGGRESSAWPWNYTTARSPKSPLGPKSSSANSARFGPGKRTKTRGMGLLQPKIPRKSRRRRGEEGE